MTRRFREVRIQKKIKLIDAAKILGIAQPTLSAWEGERKEPNIESIKRMAELYGVSIEYLLGYDSYEKLSKTEQIPFESVPIFHGKPVWVPEKGWALVNAIDKIILFSDGSNEKIDCSTELYFASPLYVESELKTDLSLPLDEIHTLHTVWVEPISQDTKLREVLRGTYTVKEEYVENTRGSRFHFDNYQALWLAYRTDEI